MSNIQGPKTPVERELALSAKKMVIQIPAISQRTWKTLEEVMKVYKPEEIVQIVHRYCDSQDHAKAYRVRRAEKIKMMEALIEEHGLSEELEG